MSEQQLIVFEKTGEFRLPSNGEYHLWGGEVFFSVPASGSDQRREILRRVELSAMTSELAELRKRCAIETAIVEAYTKWRDADEVFHKANDSFDPEWTGQRLNAAIRESNQAKQELDTLLAVRREQKGDE